LNALAEPDSQVTVSTVLMLMNVSTVHVLITVFAQILLEDFLVAVKLVSPETVKIAKISTNVLMEATTVPPTQNAPTQKVHSHAHVTLDSLVMVSLVSISTNVLMVPTTVMPMQTASIPPVVLNVSAKTVLLSVVMNALTSMNAPKVPITAVPMLIAKT
jgi:hypothetical protein